MSLLAFADDSDPIMQYTGEWQKVEDNDALNSTLSVTVVPGSTITFTFSGSQIAAIGALAANTPASFRAEFSVDGSLPITYIAPEGVTQRQEAVTFFESGSLSDEQHVLFINVTSTSQDAPFSFDGVDFYPSSIGTTANASYVISALSPVATSGVGVTGNTSQPSKSTPVGAIVGGVIGGLTVLVMAASAIFYFCYRHRRARPYYYSSANVGDLLHHEFKVALEVAPYTVFSASSSTILPRSNSTAPSNPPAAIDVPLPSTYLPTTQPPTPARTEFANGTAYAPSNNTGTTSIAERKLVRTTLETSTEVVGDSPPGSKAETDAASSLVSQPTAYCEDSGIRLPAEGASSSDIAMNTDNPNELGLNYVPPSYSEV